MAIPHSGFVRDRLRHLRVVARQIGGSEPRVPATLHVPLEFHGGDTGGWMIVRDSLSASAVVVDVGLGEDVSFSESIIRRFGCVVHGFDPTPRAIRHVETLANANMRLHPVGLGATEGEAEFFLPNNAAHVSGSVTPEQHLGRERIRVPIITLAGLFELIGADHIDLLKLDIEGTEYDVIESPDFRERASRIGQFCVEFHHRWAGRGKASTDRAVRTLGSLGFHCAWVSPTTNEEFLFVRRPS